MCKRSECLSTQLQVFGTVNFSAKYVFPLRAGSVFFNTGFTVLANMSVLV
jgi:hypothetical protein